MSPANFLWMLLSLMVHLLLIIPLLAGWMAAKPPLPAPPPKVQVHLSKPTAKQEPPKLAAKPASSSSSGSRHVEKSAPVRRTRPRPEPLQRMVAARPVPTTQSQPPPQRMPSVDSGNYPTAPQGQRNGSGKGQGSGNGRGDQPGTGGEDGTRNGTANGRGHVEIGPKITHLPTNVPIPEPLKKVVLNHFEMKMEITVDVTGKAKIRLMESCGSSQMDVFVMGELERTPWKPATSDGHPVVNVFRLVMYGEMRPNSSTFSITGLETAE